LLAIIIYFWSDLINLLKGFFLGIFTRQSGQNFYTQLAWIIIIGTIPSVLAGYFLSEWIEQIFRSVAWVMVMLVLGGILFIWAEKASRKDRDFKSLTIGDGLIIGLAQVLAFIPGVSRSGITIVAGLWRDFSRREAARFSFLLSVPVILGANIRKISQIDPADFSETFIFVSILGAAVAALLGYFIIKLLLKFLDKHSLTYFAVYRFILAALLGFIFLF